MVVFKSEKTYKEEGAGGEDEELQKKKKRGNEEETSSKTMTILLAIIFYNPSLKSKLSVLSTDNDKGTFWWDFII